MIEGAPHCWKDGESGEDEFAERLKSRLGDRARGCPDPELILAAQSDSIPEEIQTRVRQHLDRCPTCALLARDLAAPDVLALSNEEERRIRRRVFGAIPREGRPFRSRWIGWVLVPVAASLVVVGVYSRRPPATEQPRVARQEPPTQTPVIAESSVLKLTKPPLQVPAALLLFRGDEDPSSLALAQAFAAYRRDDYAAASKLLDGLRRPYPKMSEVHFYHGVSLLFLGRHADAVPSLETAKRTAEGAFARETRWYLALAHHLSGNVERSAVELDELCGGAGAHQTEACAGKAELANPPAR